jgi:TonB family protein
MWQSKKRLTATLVAIALFCASSAFAAETRKLKSQTPPILPEMAKRMNLKGTVRLEVEIGADGTVKGTKALGGHPLLIQSAEQAVRKWRYEPGPVTKTVVEFNFHEN